MSKDVDTLDIIAAWVGEAQRRTGCLSRYEMALLAAGAEALEKAGRAPARTKAARPDAPVSVLARRVVRLESRLRRVLRAVRHGMCRHDGQPGVWSRNDRPRNTFGRAA